VVRYQKRISGLLLDWFDFNVEVLPEVTNLAVIGYKSLYRTLQNVRVILVVELCLLLALSRCTITEGLPQDRERGFQLITQLSRKLIDEKPLSVRGENC
jgi:hypothetical protein